MIEPQMTTVEDLASQLAADRARLRRVEHVLSLAGVALESAEKSCRYHGTDFDRSGAQWGLPRCDSCKQPLRVRKALDAIADLAVPVRPSVPELPPCDLTMPHKIGVEGDPVGCPTYCPRRLAAEESRWPS